MLFNTYLTEILASQSEVDGKFNGKNVQVKASLVTWNKTTGKNNSASIATVCEMNKALFEWLEKVTLLFCLNDWQKFNNVRLLNNKQCLTNL